MIDPQRARDELGALVAGPLSDDDILDRYARVVWNSLTEPRPALRTLPRASRVTRRQAS